jgi:AcrR family transcriptional regulator
VTLTREDITTAAADLLDSGGEEGLTMRRLGDALGVHVPMIYAHVDGKNTIVGEVLERTMAELLHEPDDQVPWPDELRRLMVSLRRHLGRHPWMTRLSQQTVPPSLHAFGDGVQALVARAGLSPSQARMYRRLVAWTVWGFATVEAGSPAVGQVEHAGRATPAEVDELFAAAVDGIIRGIEAAAMSGAARPSRKG